MRDISKYEMKTKLNSLYGAIAVDTETHKPVYKDTDSVKELSYADFVRNRIGSENLREVEKLIDYVVSYDPDLSDEFRLFLIYQIQKTYNHRRMVERDC